MEKLPPENWMRRLRKLLADQQGATTLEWALLLGAIALPSYYLIQGSAVRFGSALPDDHDPERPAVPLNPGVDETQ